jgi:hypothetical protein
MHLFTLFTYPYGKIAMMREDSTFQARSAPRFDYTYIHDKVEASQMEAISDRQIVS